MPPDQGVAFPVVAFGVIRAPGQQIDGKPGIGPVQDFQGFAQVFPFKGQGHQQVYVGIRGRVAISIGAEQNDTFRLEFLDNVIA